MIRKILKFYTVLRLIFSKFYSVKSCLFLFPEGTFYDITYPLVIQKSVDYCKQIGVEPFKNLLTPRSRALKEIGKHFRNRLDAILDITIVYPFTRKTNGVRLSSPSIIGKTKLIFYITVSKEEIITEYFSGFHREAEIHVRLIDMKDFPEDCEEMEKWLLDLYRNKDKLLEEYYSTNKSVSETFNCENGIVYRLEWKTILLIHLIVWSLVMPFFFIPNGILIYSFIHFTLLTICTIHLYITFKYD